LSLWILSSQLSLLSQPRRNKCCKAVKPYHFSTYGHQFPQKPPWHNCCNGTSRRRNFKSPRKVTKKMISLVQASTATPQNKVSTTELVASMMHKFSPEMINSICSLGVENRYSAMNNYADFLSGAPANMTSSTTELGVNATRRCIEEWGGDPSQIGLLVAATNTPDQMLPCLASEVMGRTHGLLPRSLSTVSMQSQGCSVMLKSVEVAQWYLAANPGKMAMVLMSEAHTPLAGPLYRDEYWGFREIARMRKSGQIDDVTFEQQRI